MDGPGAAEVEGEDPSDDVMEICPPYFIPIRFRSGAPCDGGGGARGRPRPPAGPPG